MLRLAADENFNANIVRGLLRRLPDLDIVRVQDAGLSGAEGFDYLLSLKDRAMAETADYELMVWDGKSKGTINNVVNLSRDHKPVVVYLEPARQFRTIKSFDDLKDLLGNMPEAVVIDGFPGLEYISEDDLSTWEGWLKYQAFDLSALSEEEAAAVRALFDEAVRAHVTTRTIGRMKLKRPGESTYAIAIRDGTDLLLALWIKRSSNSEYFIFHPTTDGNWNPHSSLHKDGTFHMKSHDKVMLKRRRKQPPSAVKGTEHLGAYGGFGPKAVGAVCDPADFTGVFEVPPGVLGPRNGMVTVDLMEPGSGAEPLMHPAEEVARHSFDDAAPHVLVRIFRT